MERARITSPPAYMLVSEDSLDIPLSTHPRAYGSVLAALRGELDYYLRTGPVRVWRGAGQTRVEVLRFFEIVADAPTHTIKAFWLDSSDVRREVGVRWPDGGLQRIDFSLGRLLPGPWWLRFALARWFPSRMHPDRAAMFDDPGTEVGAALFRAHFELAADLRFIALERALPAMFPQMQPAIDLAISLGWSQYRAMHGSTLNMFWPVSANLHLVASENPQLVALGAAYQMHRKPRSATCEDHVREAKRELRAFGVSKRAWSELAREGDGLLFPAWQAMAPQADVSRFEVAAIHLLMRQRLGTDIPINALTLHLMAGAWALPGCLAGSGLEPLGKLPDAFLRQACLRAPASPDHDGVTAWLEDVRVIGAWLSTLQRMAQLVWSRRPWDLVLARARAAHKREQALRESANVTLPCQPPELEFPGPYRLIPLRTAAALLEEGWTMRHCAWSYVDDAQAGLVMAWSVQFADRHVATLGITRAGPDDAWKRFEIRGFANCEVEQPLRLLGRQAFEQCRGSNEAAVSS